MVMATTRVMGSTFDVSISSELGHPPLECLTAPFEPRGLLFGDGNAGEMGDAVDGRAIDGHETWRRQDMEFQGLCSTRPGSFNWGLSRLNNVQDWPLVFPSPLEGRDREGVNVKDLGLYPLRAPMRACSRTRGEREEAGFEYLEGDADLRYQNGIAAHFRDEFVGRLIDDGKGPVMARGSTSRTGEKRLQASAAVLRPW